MLELMSPAIAVSVLVLVSASNTHRIGWISFPIPLGGQQQQQQQRHRNDMALAVLYDVFGIAMIGIMQLHARGTGNGNGNGILDATDNIRGEVPPRCIVPERNERARTRKEQQRRVSYYLIKPKACTRRFPFDFDNPL
eukprot:jgi/Psemu1/6789/gm1.6789_g